MSPRVFCRSSEGPMLDPSVGVYRVHGKALKDGIVGWVTVAGNQGTLGRHVSYRAGWLANPWASLVYIGFQRCFWCIICVYMIYDIHMYIYIAEISQRKKPHTSSLLKDYENTQVCCHSIFISKTQQIGKPFNVWLGLSSSHSGLCLQKSPEIEQFFGWY